MSRVTSVPTDGSLARSPFVCKDSDLIIFSYCNVWDLGRLCQSHAMLYAEIMQHFQDNKKKVFRNEYTDVRVEVSIYNKMQVHFQQLYRSDLRTLRQAIDFLAYHRIYHDCKRWYYIVDDWNTYTGYGAYPHVEHYAMMVYEESSSDEDDY